MECNTKINKDLVLISQDGITREYGSYIYVDVYHDDKLIATLTYRYGEIQSVEITNISPRILELITSLLLDTKDELLEWLEEVA